MARLRVHIRLDRLRAHLAAEDKEPKAEADVRTWLRDSGFAAAGGGWWLVEERDLGQLRPSEVAGIEDAVTIRAPAVAGATPASPAPAVGDAVEAA